MVLRSCSKTNNSNKQETNKKTTNQQTKQLKQNKTKSKTITTTTKHLTAVIDSRFGNIFAIFLICFNTLQQLV